MAVVAARAAGSADLAAITDLATSAIDQLRPLKGGAVWADRDARHAPVLDRLAVQVDDPSTVVAVGTVGSVVVGYAVAVEDHAHATISDLYVSPASRGVGIGHALLTYVLGWAAGLGCSGIDSMALPGDRETKNFFESHGLVARSIIVHRSLVADGADIDGRVGR